MSVLRKHWPLILLIGAGLLWWRIVDVFTPPEITNDLLRQSIDYWSIVPNPTFGRVALLVAVVIALLTFFWLVRFSKIRIPYRILWIIVTLAICAASILSSFNLNLQSGSNRTIRHITSVSYQGKTYHLAFSNYFSTDVPDYIPRYHVFECDASGNICSQIYTSDSDFDDKATLMVSGDRLVLVRFGEQDQILPSTN